MSLVKWKKDELFPEKETSKAVAKKKIAIH